VSATGIILSFCRSGFVSRARIFFFAAFVSLLIFANGCQTKALTDPIIGPDYASTNVFRKEAVLPATVRRVAILPISYNAGDAAAVAGEQMLEPMLEAELKKAARFETTFVKPEQLRLWTGRERWDAFDQLPPDMLRVIGEKTDCDAILFPRLTQFSAYPPIMIGGRMQLVTLDADIIWSIDELFDSAEERVSNSARRFDRARVKSNPVLEDSRSILLAPTSFGQYTAHEVFSTLPRR
jgi:hypothetical protein